MFSYFCLKFEVVIHNPGKILNIKPRKNIKCVIFHTCKQKVIFSISKTICALPFGEMGYFQIMNCWFLLRVWYFDSNRLIKVPARLLTDLVISNSTLTQINEAETFKRWMAIRRHKARRKDVNKQIYTCTCTAVLLFPHIDRQIGR